MSNPSRFSTGLANSSGELGKNFIPHINAGFEAFLTPFIGKPSINEEGFLDHAYIPSFITPKNATIRAASASSSTIKTSAPSAGPKMSKAWALLIRRRSRLAIRLSDLHGYQEMLPNPESLHRSRSRRHDEYGLPRARRHWKLSDDDTRLYNDMKKWVPRHSRSE